MRPNFNLAEKNQLIPSITNRQNHVTRSGRIIFKIRNFAESRVGLPIGDSATGVAKPSSARRACKCFFFAVRRSSLMLQTSTFRAPVRSRIMISRIDVLVMLERLADDFLQYAALLGSRSLTFLAMSFLKKPW